MTFTVTIFNQVKMSRRTATNIRMELIMDPFYYPLKTKQKSKECNFCGDLQINCARNERICCVCRIDFYTAAHDERYINAKVCCWCEKTLSENQDESKCHLKSCALDNNLTMSALYFRTNKFIISS